TTVATCHGSDHGVAYQILPLRLKSGLGGHYIPGISCSSWRLGVEAHNIINWKTIPQVCVGYIGNYLLGYQYRSDSKAVAREAYLYAKSLSLSGDGKDIWVFDIDETSLSNLQYYADHGFGVEPYNSTLFNEWVDLGVAPALPESHK
ncbi:hypothetical protein EI015_25810, partial [Escherichia coli]|nr:hypothetical protein [Escherichia coli]